MAKITNIDSKEKARTINIDNGLTVMEGAVQRIYRRSMQITEAQWLVLLATFMSKEEWYEKLNKPEEAEQDMIDMAYEPKNSRLSCQISVSDEIDGLTVTTPAKQS